MARTIVPQSIWGCRLLVVPFMTGVVPALKDVLAPPEPSPNDRLTIRLTKEQKARLESASRQTGGISISRIVRTLVDTHLDELLEASGH